MPPFEAAKQPAALVASASNRRYGLGRTTLPRSSSRSAELNQIKSVVYRFLRHPQRQRYP